MLINQVLKPPGTVVTAMCALSFCRIVPNTRGVSKRLGTAHIAIGDNRSLGGKSSSTFHIDFLFLNPSVYFDDKCIIKDGEYQIKLMENKVFDQPGLVFYLY